jgi:hypothetical protein
MISKPLLAGVGPGAGGGEIVVVFSNPGHDSVVEQHAAVV